MLIPALSMKLGLIWFLRELTADSAIHLEAPQRRKIPVTGITIPEAIRARRKQLMKEHIEKNGIEKKPDVDEILDYLRSKNIKTAVATATDPERTKQYLTQIGIYDKFDQLVSATTVENGKPEPDVYLYACEQIGEKPKDCIAVEDSPNGILSAYRAGLSVVMVPDLAEPDEETAKLLYAKFDTLAGLKTII